MVSRHELTVIHHPRNGQVFSRFLLLATWALSTFDVLNCVSREDADIHARPRRSCQVERGRAYTAGTMPDDQELGLS